MPALAPEPETQFMVVVDAGSVCGDAARKLAAEAELAVRRVGHVRRWFDGSAAGAVSLRQGVLGPVSSLADLREFAASRGVADFDQVVVGAARHFSSAALIRPTDPLSHADVESVSPDDDRHAGG